MRPAVASDSEAIAALLGELGYPAAGSEVTQRLSQLKQFGRALILVAELDGQLAGVITAHVFPAIHSSQPIAWLTALVVGVQHQRKGVGKLLTNEVEKWARSHQAARLSVASREHRTGAHAFYESLGYERNGIRLTKFL